MAAVPEHGLMGQMETIWEMQLFIPSFNPLLPRFHLPSVLSEAESLHADHNDHLKAGVVFSFLETKACSLSSSDVPHR